MALWDTCSSTEVSVFGTNPNGRLHVIIDHYVYFKMPAKLVDQEVLCKVGTFESNNRHSTGPWVVILANQAPLSSLPLSLAYSRGVEQWNNQ